MIQFRAREIPSVPGAGGADCGFCVELPAMNTFDLTGLTAFVTGSSRGIGRAAALELARGGAKVLLHGSRVSPALDSAFDAVRAAGAGAARLIGDISSSADVDRLAAEAAAADIVVLNASVQSYCRVGEMTDGDWAAMFEANVRSSFRFVKAFAPAMAARGFGRIICIGSVNAARPAPRLAVYASSKAALRSLVVTAAQEYGARGVTVNTLTPGVIATDRNASALSDETFAENLRASIPARRFGTPEDCAGAIRFLASREASYINGADLAVDGGFSL